MKKILSLFALSILTSCSVMMASKRDGVEFESIQNLETRAQMLALAGETVSSYRNEKGDLVETYKILKERGSAARALMHGLLDIGTAFIWEFVGTPIESALKEEKYLTITVTYNTTYQIQKIELL